MKKPLLFLAAFFACVIAYFSLRSLIGAAAAAVVAGLSASAIAAGTAGSAKAAGGGAAAAHIPAAVGALAGALLLAVNLRGRPWLERAVLALASYLAAYYGALAAHEAWGLGAGGVGVAGTACAYLGVAVLDAAQRILRDAEFMKRIIDRRTGG